MSHKPSSLTHPRSGLTHLDHLFEFLPRDLIRAGRCLRMLTLLVIDFDAPERLESYPEEMRDQLLGRLSALLASRVRESDQLFEGALGRFALVLPETPKDEALRVAERFRRSVPALLAKLDPAASSPWTISAGVAAFPADANSAEQLWAGALGALEHARSSGGNCSWLCGDDRRSSRRLVAELPARLHLLGTPPVSATLNRVSSLGLGFQTEALLEVDQLVVLELPLSGGAPLTITTRVAWSVHEEDQKCSGGLRILEMSAGDRHRWLLFLAELATAADPTES